MSLEKSTEYNLANQVMAESQQYSRKDLALKYGKDVDYINRLFFKHEIRVPVFIKNEIDYIYKNYEHQNDRIIARKLGKPEQMIMEFRLRHWYLRQDEWVPERITVYLKKMNILGQCICEKNLKNKPNIMEAIYEKYGSFQKAMEEAGLDYAQHAEFEEEVVKEYPLQQRVVQKILELKNQGLPLNPYYIQNYMEHLYAAALMYFNTWKQALKQCKIEYHAEIERGYRAKGRYFQDIVREILQIKGIRLGEPQSEENPEGLKPDFYDLENSTWIDAKLHPWGYGVEETINKYQKWSKELWIIYADSDENALHKMEKKYRRVKFICINEYYDMLEDKGRTDLIDEINALKIPNYRSEKYQEYHTRIKEVHLKKRGRLKNQRLLNQTSGCVGSIKPVVFVNQDGLAVINSELKDEEIKLPWRFSKEKFKELAREIVQEIFEKNREYFIKKQDTLPTNLDPNEFLDKYEKHQMTSQGIINTSYRINFAYNGRVYRARHFVRTARETKDISGKEQIYNDIKSIIEENGNKQPLGDAKILKILKEKGHSIARRTVTKYRQELGYKSSSRRRKDQKVKLAPSEEIALALLKTIKPDNPDYISAMIEGLRSKNKHIQKYCYLAVKDMKKAALPILMEQLKESKKDLLPTIIILLAAIGPEAEKSIGELKKCLNSENKKIASLAEYAMKKIMGVTQE